MTVATINPEPKERNVVMIGSVVVPVRFTASGIVALITPAVARNLLAQNQRNRKVRRSWVARLARDMAAGHWALNGETLIFAEDGDLMDGQHRLLACVLADVTFETFIVPGIAESARATLGDVQKRTFGDVLGFEDESQGKDLAAVLRTAWRIENNGHLFNGAGIPNPTWTELRDYLHANPTIRHSVSFAGQLRKSVIRYRPSLGGALHYLTMQVDEREATEFWDRLIDGVGLYPGHPVLALRLLLLRDLAATRRMDETAVAANTIKAWNAFRAKRQVRSLRWRRGGKRPEVFPKIES